MCPIELVVSSELARHKYMICNTCKFKSDCQKATENGDCRYYEKQEGIPINEHPLNNEILDKIKSGKIVFS